MYQNFSSFLANSLRFLNIANRVIPLVREVSPQIGKIRNTIKKVSSITSNTSQNNQTALNAPKEQIIAKNNTLTFFK